ncbi:MAG: DUF4160 domain-containing protein [Terriglobales bacterium]
MLTVLQNGADRFYTGERNKPPHIHVERDRHTAKFCLEPVHLQKSGGFGGSVWTSITSGGWVISAV